MIAEERERMAALCGRSGFEATLCLIIRRIEASMTRIRQTPKPMQTDWRSFLILKKIRDVPSWEVALRVDVSSLHHRRCFGILLVRKNISGGSLVTMIAN